MQEGKTIKSSSGFSGKGFKFDETEHALANERKKLQKAALGLQDSDDEDGALDVSYFTYHTLIEHNCFSVYHYCELIIANSSQSDFTAPSPPD